MNDAQLLRYSRHILLPKIGFEGQEKLNNSHALIIGAGGLGCAAALYLAVSGVGRLTICDFDNVELSNLQRQVLHTHSVIGMNKALSAQSTLLELNPEVQVIAVTEKLGEQDCVPLVVAADVVLDCSDNFATREALNRVSVAQRKPLVSGAAIGFSGQVSVFNTHHSESPCYHCLFPKGQQDDEVRCLDNGVFAPLVGIIGTVQATEALKIILGLGESLQGRLLLLDALGMEWRSLRLRKDPNCVVCSNI
ncbi:MAG: molybdopterin-synthase adenylyltransferase MoeB [Methylophilaceae bacterium]|nr:molybdopterin-synthase adenylyltransferase MoeB [Methylophilaceae bacterium]